MKKIISLIAAALVATSAFAQIEVGAGYTNSALSDKLGNTTTTTELNGFYVGAGYTLNLTNEINLTPGLYYNFLTGDAPVGDTWTEHYLNVPVSFSYGYEVHPEVKLFAYAGPTFSLGLASKIKGTLAGTTYTTDMYDGTDYGKFDILAGGGIGAEFLGCYRFRIGYDYGLLNRYTGDNDETYHRKQIVVGFSYAF